MAITSGAHEDSSGFSDINVTPLTDVLLVLLIIFLITGSSITAPSHEIALPSVITKEKVENISVVIDVTPTGQWFIGNLQCDRKDLQPYLQKLAKKRHTDKVIINGDSNVPYKFVLIAVNAARQAGLTNVALATEFVPNKKDLEAPKANPTKAKAQAAKNKKGPETTKKAEAKK